MLRNRPARERYHSTEQIRAAEIARLAKQTSPRRRQFYPPADTPR